ncbi:hypothetical protein CEH05_20480 (plasmid) [Halobacillus halophilus]|nr:hypothetical protein CEH05_20480 [Halobacillus halophilus]
MNYNVRLTSEQLKQLRIIKGISVRKFGRSVDLSAAYISLMENGKRTIPPKVDFFERYTKRVRLNRSGAYETRISNGCDRKGRRG